VTKIILDKTLLDLRVAEYHTHCSVTVCTTRLIFYCWCLCYCDDLCCMMKRSRIQCYDTVGWARRMASDL